jgi:hypothetical protein
MLTPYRVTQLNRDVAKGIEAEGEYYFQPSKLMDAFGLAAEAHEATTAIDLMLTFNKQLNALQCDLMKVGFVRLPQGNEPHPNSVGAWHAFTYTVQSRKHDNRPLVVTEAFELASPSITLANMTATTWISAYRRRPQVEIFGVAQSV